MAKIDAATRSASMQRVDLTALAQGATADNVPLAADAGIDLGFEGQGEIMVSAEPLLIGELMKNLIGNALLYAGHGAEVTVRVRAEGEAAVLEVEDDGPGIPPEKRASVLRRFDRGDRSDKLGTGLGLPIVEEIAHLHGAEMTLGDGRDGRGLKVEIRFPIAG